jgi:alkanesulfonate monooxygenase SsuD/methylene tetrahydromethanopterin reductase-like flavin-dependent oxidoreductase (luciferase family)
MVVFGFGAHPGIDDGPGLLCLAQQADQDGLDLFSLSDHPYLGGRLDAYAGIGFLLGATSGIAGFANVTNLPTRPAPMLARTVTSLSALSGGRVVLGVGAGGILDRVTELGAPRLSPAAAVEAFDGGRSAARRAAHRGRTWGRRRTAPGGERARPTRCGRAARLSGLEAC